MAGFGSHHHQMHAELAVLLAAPSSQLQATSLASTMAIVPHHAAATYTGEAPKRASESTWFGKGPQLEIGLEFMCLGGYGWIPHNAGFGFLDRALLALGVFASLDRF
jgi:hypothetical protein